jgi:hypothetical protein
MLGFHKYEKFMGPVNIGNGRFRQQYKCIKCGKVKAMVS